MMDKEKLTFIEQSGLLFEELGMTRMEGRVLGYLLISDKDEASFNQIRNVLDASKGSISITTRQLIQVGLIEPVSIPGDRKTYFKVTELELSQILKKRMKLFEDLSEMFHKARQVKKRDDTVSDWLLEASVFYSWVGIQLDVIIDKWHHEKSGIMNKYRSGNESEERIEN